MKRVTLTVMALIFAAAIATTAMAFGPGWGSGRGPGYGPCGGGEFGYRGLDLTAEQKAKMSEMRDAQFKEMGAAPQSDVCQAGRTAEALAGAQSGPGEDHGGAEGDECPQGPDAGEDDGLSSECADRSDPGTEGKDPVLCRW